MQAEADDQLTRLLARAAHDPAAARELMPLVYETLKSIARRRMASERPDHTLQATALVNECYLRLFGKSGQAFAGRAQFYFTAADAMHRILVEHARSQKRVKRGGRVRRVPLNVLDLAASPEPGQVLAFDEALGALEKESAQTARVVRLRFFAGLSVQETADAMGICTRTVNREWAFARAWLFDALRDEVE